jgi:hypothetical protein
MPKLPESRWCDTEKCKKIGKNHTHTPEQCGARCWNPKCIALKDIDHYAERCGRYNEKLPTDGQLPSHYAWIEKKREVDMARRAAIKAAAAASTDTPAPESSSGGAGEPETPAKPAKPETWAAKVKKRKPKPAKAVAAPVAEPAPEPAAQVAAPPDHPLYAKLKEVFDAQQVKEKLFEEVKKLLDKHKLEIAMILEEYPITIPPNRTVADWLPGYITGMFIEGSTTSELKELSEKHELLFDKVAEAITVLAEHRANLEAAKAAE